MTTNLDREKIKEAARAGKNRNGLYILLGAVIIAAVILYTNDNRLPVIWEKNSAPMFHEVNLQSGLIGPDIQLTATTFRDIAQAVVPAVVNISTTKKYRSRHRQNDDLFRFFFGDSRPRERYRSYSLGTGVIINEDGYILTNQHVVAGADQIQVTLENNKSYDAQIMGKDTRTDLTLLKINALQSLPYVPMGDSEELLVGDWVVAVGNPFGLGHTVTTGIVSAKDRKGLDEGNPYEAFIQTDAAINPGNSGGPLINLHGELVGINTAIVSRTGQYSGIGFAIPINLVKDVVVQLREKGAVERPYLGVSIREMNAYYAQQLDLPEDTQGALIMEIYRNSPAHRHGIEPGDVIYEFDGTPVKTSDALIQAVSRTKPGDEVDIKLYRDRKRRTVDLVMGRYVED